MQTKSSLTKTYIIHIITVKFLRPNIGSVTWTSHSSAWFWLLIKKYKIKPGLLHISGSTSVLPLNVVFCFLLAAGETGTGKQYSSVHWTEILRRKTQWLLFYSTVEQFDSFQQACSRWLSILLSKKGPNSLQILQIQKQN